MHDRAFAQRRSWMLIAVALAGCTSERAPARPVPSAPAVSLRAPDCSHDSSWSLEDAGGDAIGLINGVPARATAAQNDAGIEVTDLETGRHIARVTLPEAPAAWLVPTSFAPTPSGTVLHVATTERSETFGPLRASYVVRFDSANHTSIAKLRLVKGGGASHVTAVGDHLVLVEELEEEAGQRPRHAVGIFDASGAFIDEVDDPGTSLVIPLAPTTFAVTTTLQDGRYVLRRWDLGRRDWVGFPVELTHLIQDWAPLGGRRTLVVGRLPAGSGSGDPLSAPLAVAAIDGAGIMTMWTPLGIDGRTARVLSRPDGSALVVALAGERAFQTFAVGQDLTVVPASSSVPANPAAFRMTALLGRDHLYVAQHEGIERYRCR